MSFLHRLTHFLQDPPPDYVFEVSESGIAWAKPAGAVSFHSLEPGVLDVSPLADNVHKADALAGAIRAIAGGAGRKRGRAVVILPDFAARVAVLSFDQFPADPKEQLSLVRFRMKKSVPFDVESAAVSYHSQAAKGPTDVVVVAAALEIVSRYEAAFRAAGLQPGYVTTSAVAMADLNRAPGITIIARLNGRILTVVVMNGPALRLVRTVEASTVTADEVLAVLFPTMAYVEDEMGTHAARVLLCGFGEGGRLPEWSSELQIPVEPLQSRFGMPTGQNAGLLGYLEATAPGAKAA
jgi:type IV pilus assembly protein PilM